MCSNVDGMYVVVNVMLSLYWFHEYDDICMCVVNKQFELLEFVFRSVYVDLKYN